MQVKLWKNFSKKYNSTKQPDDSLAVIKNATLKSPTSVESPTFMLEGNDIDYNYVQALGHYYFVDNIILSANNITELQCSQDLLATYKDYISAYNTMIDRSESSANLYLSDSEVISTTEIVSSTITDGDTLAQYDASGSYVVRVVGKNGVKNYVLTMNVLKAAFNSFFAIEDIDFTDVPKAIKSLFKSISEPGQYIKSVKWFPFNCAGSSSEVCYFGFAPTVDASTGSEIAMPIAVEQLFSGCTITKPARHYNDWRDFDSRFTTASVWLPGLGAVSFDAKYLQHTLQCSYFVDTATGEASIWITSGSELIGTYAGQCGVDVQVGGLGGGTGQLTSIGQMFSGVGLNPLNFASGIAKGYSGVLTSTLTPSQTVCGNAGNKSIWISQPFVRCAVSYLGSTDKPTTSEGFPLRKNVTIGSLTGFVKCANASITLPSLGNDRNAVNAMLNSGFYYE